MIDIIMFLVFIFRLKRYIYNYLVKRNLHTTALAFKNEADVLAPDVPVGTVLNLH